MPYQPPNHLLNDPDVKRELEKVRRAMEENRRLRKEVTERRRRLREHLILAARRAGGRRWGSS